MLAQLGRVFLASPPAPAFGTSATVVSSRRLAPRNVRSDRVPRLYSAGARVLTPSSAGRRGPLAMALAADGAAFLLADARGNLSEILVKNVVLLLVNLERRCQQQ